MDWARVTTARTRLELAGMLAGVGAELGVAAGDYSEAILRVPAVTRLYSVDRWGDHHDTAEYGRACRRLSAFGARSVVLRKTFEEAAAGFADRSLDFIYIDGYAHTGQEHGATLRQWWPKLKPGGIFAGHDYCPQYRATMAQVDRFAAWLGLPVHVTDGDELASWVIRRPALIFTAFYTRGTRYEEEAARLVASLNRLGLAHDVTAIEDRGSWTANSRCTAAHVCEALARHPHTPVVQLDADAVVLRRPELFETLSCDVAAYRLANGRLANGTVYFAATEPAREVAWTYRNLIDQGHHPHDEQRCLHDAARLVQAGGALKLRDLPASYCCIPDINGVELGEEPPVILHLQASREQGRHTLALASRRSWIEAVGR